MRSASVDKESREEEIKLKKEEKVVEEKYKLAVASGTAGAKGISSGRGEFHLFLSLPLAS